MQKKLQLRGLIIGKEQVRKLMVEHGIREKKRKFVVTTDSKHSLPVAAAQDWEGWLYLAAVMDMFSR